jgi:demethylspheroidene O-methyltransferase
MGVRAYLGDLRNRLVGDPEFRRKAKANPFTRGQAVKSARALFDLTAGFVYSQTLLACVETELFEFLRNGPRTLDDIAAQTGLPREGAERLARAAASLDLLEARGPDRFALGPLGAPLVDEPGLCAMIRHHRLLYEDLADPLAVLRGEARGALAAFWGYGLEDGRAGDADDYSDLMAATNPMVADEIFAAIDLKGRRRLMDVGGGEGAFISELARRAPDLALALFDLPPVAERARARLADWGLADRVEVHGGSFTADSLPKGCDTISLVRILHDHDDATVRTLLAACRDALPRGGLLLIAEPMAGARGAEPMGEAYFGFYLMAMGRGRPRSARDIMSLVEDAGFSQPQLQRSRMPLIADIVTARS